MIRWVWRLWRQIRLQGAPKAGEWLFYQHKHHIIQTIMRERGQAPDCYDLQTARLAVMGLVEGMS